MSGFSNDSPLSFLRSVNSASIRSVMAKDIDSTTLKNKFINTFTINLYVSNQKLGINILEKIESSIPHELRNISYIFLKIVNFMKLVLKFGAQNFIFYQFHTKLLNCSIR